MSQWNLNSLTKYTRIDREKKRLIDDILPTRALYCKGEYSEEYDLLESKSCLSDEEIEIEPTKICPECGRKYPDYENFCLNCSVKLKDIEKVNVKAIEVSHDFLCKGTNSFTDFAEIFTKDNLLRINSFEFEISDFKEITGNIRATAISNLDSAIKENEIVLSRLTILEKVILFAKSFVDIEYKSYGGELGYYSFNRIFVDDRQLDSLQITTILHELTHFLIKEILTHTLCRLLDASKTKEIESIVTFIMSYSNENCLVDEYAAHTVEGRFTLFGYQDYSSFLNIQKTIDLTPEEIEMLKTIANSFANVIKGIVESFIDDELLDDIKVHFRPDILDDPNYEQLKLENCTLLTDEGFLRAVQFILLDGFAAASENQAKLCEINGMW